MEIYLLPNDSRSHYLCSFTLQFSGFWVERGGLGEVVSLVGDCRPPPPSIQLCRVGSEADEDGRLRQGGILFYLQKRDKWGSFTFWAEALFIKQISKHC
jgi:hypothetical protein